MNPNKPQKQLKTDLFCTQSYGKYNHITYKQAESGVPGDFLSLDLRCAV
jgi:hypothetical protein